jgi:type IV pilus assembly protein PilB
MQLKEVWDRMLINQELAALYLKHKLVAKSQLNPLVEEFKGTNKRIDTELLAQHIVTEEGNAVVLAEFFEMEYADISLIEPDSKCVHLVTPAFVRRHSIIPITKQKGELIVAISNPFDYEGLRRIHSFAKGRIKVLVSTKTKIDNIANLIFSKTLTAEAITSFTEVSLEEKEKLKGAAAASSDLYGGDIKSAPAVKLTDSILEKESPIARAIFTSNHLKRTFVFAIGLTVLCMKLVPLISSFIQRF